MSDRDPETGQFLQGRSGNPQGRPKGSRNKLGEEFLESLAADWSEHGPEAIRRTREEKPAEYVRIVASLLPKELLIRKDPLEEISDERLAEMIECLDAIMAQARDDPDAAGELLPTHRGAGKA